MPTADTRQLYIYVTLQVPQLNFEAKLVSLGLSCISRFFCVCVFA